MTEKEEAIKKAIKNLFGPDADFKIKVITTEAPKNDDTDGGQNGELLVTKALWGIFNDLLKVADDKVSEKKEEKKPEVKPSMGESTKQGYVEGYEFDPALSISLLDGDDRIEFGVKPDTLIVRLTSFNGKRQRYVAHVDGLTDPSQVTYIIDRTELTADFYVDVVDDDVDFIDCGDDVDNDLENDEE